MELKRTGFYHKSYMLFQAKQNTDKWNGRNLFSYSVSGMPHVVSKKKNSGVGTCKFVASNLPTESFLS